MRPVFICQGCKLSQFVGQDAKCRRCWSTALEPCPNPMFGPKLPKAEDLMRSLMLEALLRSKGNRVEAARLIGMSKTKFYRMMPPCPTTTSTPTA